jgi:uncharacterized membrane protein YkvA (DUF1232 family)
MPRKPAPRKAKSAGPKPRRTAAKAAGKAVTGSPRTKAPGPPRRTLPSSPLLDRGDIHRILADMSRDLAPGDLDTLMADEAGLRRRIRELPADFDLFRRQLLLAVDCLSDHLAGEIQQIPYFTICLLGAAVLYFTDELDAIPDFLPNVGELDDASVMAMAFEQAQDGLRRYCAATGRSLEGLLP